MELDTFVLFWGILLLLSILAVTYLYLIWPYNYYKKLGIPGPKPTPFVGNMGAFGKKLTGDIHADWFAKYGKVVGTYIGWDRQLLVADVDMLKEILIREFDSFTDHKSYLELSALKPGLFEMKGSGWKRQRDLLSPYFSTLTLKMSVGTIQQNLNNFIDLLSTKCRGKEMVEARHTVEYFTMDVICATAFGIQVNSVKQPNREIVTTAKKLMTETTANSIMVQVLFFLPSLAKILSWFNIEACDYHFIEGLIRKLIDERRQSHMDSLDFIHVLLKAQESRKHETSQTASKGLSDEEIIANCILFLLAGYDNTARALAFFLYNLTVHEQHQQKVYEEIREVIGDGEISWESVQQLSYLDMCMNESLRLHPSLMHTDRKCVKDTVINGVPIHKGTYICVPIWYLHRNPQVWENPDEFNPSRFTAENKSTRDPLHHCPFGVGPRHCIGMRLAEFEIKIATVRILQRFKLVRNEKTQVPLELDPATLTTSSKDGLWISLEERQ